MAPHALSSALYMGICLPTCSNNTKHMTAAASEVDISNCSLDVSRVKSNGWTTLTTCPRVSDVSGV